MTHGMRVYMELTSSAIDRAMMLSMSESDVASALLEQVAHVVHHARDGGLQLGGPWRLHPDALEALRGEVPEPRGGWSGFAGLLAGTEALQARSGRFAARHAPSRAATLTSESRVRCALIEAMTCGMVPPQAAAGLVLLLGVHPAWGLRLASQLHAEFQRSQGADPAPVRPEDLAMYRRMPTATLDAIREGVAVTHAVTLETLRTLDPHVHYPVSGLASLLIAATDLGRKVILGTLDSTPDTGAAQVPLFIDHLLGRDHRLTERAEDFASSDLLDSFLVPAQIATHHHDTRTFTLLPGALDVPFRIDRMNTLQRSRWFSVFLNGAATLQVV